jgi:hypothetical protein
LAEGALLGWLLSLVSGNVFVIINDWHAEDGHRNRSWNHPQE